MQRGRSYQAEKSDSYEGLCPPNSQAPESGSESQIGKAALMDPSASKGRKSATIRPTTGVQGNHPLEELSPA